MTRFTPSRNYLAAGLVAGAFSLLSGYLAWQWAPSWICAALFLLTALVLLLLAFSPIIEITDKHLKIGHRTVEWVAIRRIDHTGWVTPLVLKLTLANGKTVWLVYPADLDSAQILLQMLYRFATGALIDGKANSEGGREGSQKLAAPRFPVLSREDEDEVERLYQRLRTVGHLDQKSPDEK
jgi:hypothetical protein